MSSTKEPWIACSSSESVETTPAARYEGMKPVSIKLSAGTLSTSFRFCLLYTSKKGLFEVAGGGVIFLDELAEMTPATQAKLLRAIENRKFRRIGGVIDIRLDAAIILSLIHI